VALDGMLDTDLVMFDKDDAELADDALRLGIVIYALFLYMGEKSVGHGLAAQAREIVVRSPLLSDSS
jgi:hypothetical protein